MKILGLPGQNQSTFHWMQEILGTIQTENLTTSTQSYKFWDQPGSALDEALEIGRASEFNPDLIVAKSLGTIITLLGISQGKVSPRYCVYIGIPVSSVDESVIEILSGDHATGIVSLFIQQSHDRTGGYSQLCDLLPVRRNFTTVEVPGEDHVYSDVLELGKIINGWFGTVTE